MATLEKIRNKAGLLIIVVGVALFAFIIGDFLNSGSTYFRQSHEKVGVVDGETISIQDYQERVDEMIEMYKNQSGTSSLPEEYIAQIRQSVFDSMVQEIILDEELDKLGMTVSPEELFDMVQGENISPMIQQMSMFVNPETGVFDKSALLQFLKTIDDDNIATFPAEQQAELIAARNFWLFWERTIKRQRMEEKYTSLLSHAVATNSLDAKAIFGETAENSDVAYVMQSYNTIPDSTITVSKSEIEKLYKERKELYKQKESKRFQYVTVDIAPSQEDYNKASQEIERVKSELASTDRIADVVNENSEYPYVDAFFSADAMDAEMRQFVTTAEVGDIYGPVFENNTYKVIKLVDKTVAPDSVKVSHIMLGGATEAQIATLADSLRNALNNGGNFAEAAAQYSVDQTAQNGGELGWFTEASALGILNEEFKNAVFSTPVNQVVAVKSLYGTHLVKVDERTSNVTKYKVADIEMSVAASSKTYSDLYNGLNQFISKNRDLTKLDEAAQEAGFRVQTATVSATDQTIGGIQGSRQVIRWAFQHKKGDVSDIMECGDKFVVAYMEGTIPEGYRALSAVENSLRSELIAEKKGEQIKQELLSKNLNSLDAYANAMSSKVDSVKFVNFATRRISGMGVEPKMNAAISLAPVGQLSQPVAGNNGVYVFTVYERTPEAKEYNETEEIRNADATNAYRFGYQAVQSLVNNAKVEDNRIRFY